jgi:hypothetical protein
MQRGSMWASTKTLTLRLIVVRRNSQVNVSKTDRGSSSLPLGGSFNEQFDEDPLQNGRKVSCEGQLQI